MQTVTIAKNEYRELLDKKLRYEYLRQIMLAQDIFKVPPTRKVKDITRDFKATGKYSQKFIASLEKGLKRSSYFR